MSECNAGESPAAAISGDGSSLRRFACRIVAATAILLAVTTPPASEGEDQGADPGAAAGSPPPAAQGGYRNAPDEQQLDLLRIQIGVPLSHAKARPEAAAAPSGESQGSEPASAREGASPSGGREDEVVPASAAPGATLPLHEAGSRPAREAKPQTKVFFPRSREQERPAPRPAMPVVHSAPAPGQQESGAAVPQTTAAEPAHWSFDNSELGITERDLPPKGTVVDGSNEKRWSHLLTPGLRWALHHGASMEIVDPKPIPLESARAEATERYHDQVRLSPDKRSLENYVAGIPFPVVKDDDPDLANKLIWNHQSRIIWDDLDIPKFGCTVGRLDSNGVHVEREYRVGDFRRLFYVGRMVVEPKPTWPSEEGLRYREMVNAIEPFEYKGGVLSYNRYQDPARSDDAWLYLPLSRRVRRLSTSQRSEGVFGIDIDLDSYYGFAGNPAWFEWKMLGKKTFLAPLHSKHEPPQPCDKPGDFMFCDTWEPREMYVLSAKSLIPGYNFSRRILYIDAQSNLIPYNEVYDLDGQLWRTLILQWKAGLRRSMPYSKDAYTYKDDTIFVGSLLVFDMQASHSTYCSFPARDMAVEESAYYDRGPGGTTTPDAFDVSGIVAGAR